MARPGAHVGKAELLEKLADIALVIVDAEALGDDARDYQEFRVWPERLNLFMPLPG